jgi:hypothetical protein
MKVYACPAELPEPETDYKNYDRAKEAAKIEAHKAALKNWLKGSGYTGKRTGETVRFQVADGYAEYMLADGRKSALIHLPYYDGYSYPDVAYLPKKEILRRIEAEKNFAALFAKKN